MSRIAVAIIWHMHQPYYPDDVARECALPWVRLHAIKDYFGMAALAERFPKVKLTFNLVPSLLEQLDGYVSGRIRDRFQELGAKPARDLTEEDRQHLLAGFFMANRATMITPHPQYERLFLKRQVARREGGYHTARFSVEELRDLQLWFNLAWFHPLAVESQPALRALTAQGENFSEEDKKRVSESEQKVMKAVMPLYKKLQERGQVELTTSPYFHPILPLLVDRSSARIALPQTRIANADRRYREDARWHLASAVESHTKRFGSPPRGLWPSEGSVSRDVVPLCREAGIQWLATDEDILTLSLGQLLERDGDRNLKQPDLLYQPYRYEGEGGPMNVLFRDHYLSDLIGFQYQKADAAAAVKDLLGRVRQAARSRLARTPLVVIILDGENAWEYYPKQAMDFLTRLYRELSEASDLVTVTPSEYLAKEPPTATLETLFPGSWINHNFAIWIGHEEDNRAWSALDRTRDFLVRTLAERRDQVPAERAREAWRELYIAEGSDWFWWYGDDHSSGMDDQFDALFRNHLKNVYRLLGQEPPVFLEEPICQLANKQAIYTAPMQFLDVTVDGRPTTYFEWLGAGRYHTTNPHGTMAPASRGPIRDLYFGFNDSEFLLRIDCYRPAHQALGRFSAIRVLFDGGKEVKLQLTRCDSGQPAVEVQQGDQPPQPLAEARVACDLILELAVPFQALGLEPDRQVEFLVEFEEPGGVVTRFPRESVIAFRVPTPEFEAKMWTA